MLTRRVIPCLDTRDGRVVKGRQFVNLRDVGAPAELAAQYEQDGADEIVLLDISATPEGRRHALDTVRAVREVLAIPLTVGGGVRASEDAEALLRSGADKVSVNTAAVERPDLIGLLAERYGCQCITVAIDGSRKGDAGWQVIVRSGTVPASRDVVAWAREAADRGAGEILLTSVDRDGTRAGYDLELLRAVSEAVSVPVVASGGANSPEHLLHALEQGADAVLAASIFHDGDYTVSDVKVFLANHGVEVRL